MNKNENEPNRSKKHFPDCAEHAAYRSKKHLLLLYPDCAEHVAAFEKLKATYEHVGILHDKDTDEAGALKKPHWHIILITKNATWNTALAKELGVTVNYLERVRSEEAACHYLVHNNEETKHHYETSEVFGTPSSLKMFDKALEQGELSEGDKVLELIEIIESSVKPLTMSAFARYCAANNRWDIFRRSASIFIKMIEEQNKKLKGIDL